jgi:hypothetical protein
MTAVQKNAVNIISKLSEKKLKDALDYLSYLNDKDEWEATQELLDTKILYEIKEGLNQIKEGNYVYFKDIKRNV